MSVDEDGIEALEGEQPPHSRDQSPDKGSRVNDQNKKDSMPVNKCFCIIFNTASGKDSMSINKYQFFCITS